MLPLPANIDRSNPQSLPAGPKQDRGADRASKKRLGDSVTHSVPLSQTSLSKRFCRPSVSAQATVLPPNREQLGGKGMFLQRMKEAGLSVPPFHCVTTSVMNALEQQLLDVQCLAHYLPGIVDEPKAEISLADIRERLNALSLSEQTKRDSWLAGLAKFIASEDFYKQVKDSEAARHIRDHGLSTSQPVIVRSSGINEDNYGDAQAGKYLSEVQGEEDVLRTCLKVMASGYRPEVCPGLIPPPMALIIQQCIDCQYGGVAMSFRSFQDNTIRVEYTPGQPGSIVAGQSGNTPHRIDIYREDRKEEAGGSQYFPGTISSYFTLCKNNNGYSETRMDDADGQSNDVEQQLTDDMISDLRWAVTELEDLLCCPVDVEFAIDHQGRLFLLQVRPVTRLSGGMDFAMPIPEETLAIGEGVSEGYCTGPLWLAKQPATDSMPEGAIVVAHHAEEWMLEPEFLERAGGFVIAVGGFNDHVAILMKQQRKTLMLADGHYAAVVAQVGQQATLVCARFKGKSGAFIVAGDITGKLASHGSLSSAVYDVPLATAVPSRDDLSPAEDTFRQVASCFQWLTDQNARLLAFFASGGGLDCLANPIKLSMSPQRLNLLAETCDSVKRLVHGAEALLDGCQAFLQLAGKSRSHRVKSFRHELPQLINRFQMLKKTIESGLKSIILPVQAAEEGQLSPGIFRQWVADCHQLQSCLQALNPDSAEQVRSVHELIFSLHQRFVEVLAPVALASGQGRLSKKDRVTYVDCRAPGKPDDKAPILRQSCKTSIKALGCSGTVISMDEAVIVNLNLGSHVSLIELLENAEGGKGRTLRLKFSDDFDRTDNDEKSGKFRRMWFLAQLLKEIELDKNADSMKLSCNAVAGEMNVECSRMRSPETMQHAFEKLIIVLRAMCNLDIELKGRPIFEGGQWDFNLLAQRLNPDVATEADRFAFQHCLFAMSYQNKSTFSKTAPCCRLLSKHHQQFAHYAHRFGMYHLSLDRGRKPKESEQEILMSAEMSEDIRRELLHHFLLFYPVSAVRLIEQVYDIGNQCFVINPSRNYRLEFYVPPGQPLGDHKEKIRKTLLKHGLEYASQRVRNDKSFVLPAFSGDPCELGDLSEELKNDSDVVKAAIAKCPLALRYASKRLRDDKNIIRMAIAESIYPLSYASQKVLEDRQCMLDLIEINPQAFNYAVSGLKGDTAFIEAAKQRNPQLRQYLR